jgi:hypothetical protein
VTHDAEGNYWDHGGHVGSHRPLTENGETGGVSTTSPGGGLNNTPRWGLYNTQESPQHTVAETLPSWNAGS